MCVCVCVSVRPLHFVCPPERTGEGGGQTFLTHRSEEGQTFLHQERGGIFFIGGCVGYDDVYEEIDVSEANIVVSEASKLSAGARIFKGP